jgi:hypothetical protein
MVSSRRGTSTSSGGGSGIVCSCDDDSGRSIIWSGSSSSSGAAGGSSGVGGAGSSISSCRPGTCRTIKQHTYIHFFSSDYYYSHTVYVLVHVSRAAVAWMSDPTINATIESTYFCYSH